MSQRLKENLLTASDTSLNSRFIEIVRRTNPNDPRVLAHDTNIERQRQDHLKHEVVKKEVLLVQAAERHIDREKIRHDLTENLKPLIHERVNALLKQGFVPPKRDESMEELWGHTWLFSEIDPDPSEEFLSINGYSSKDDYIAQSQQSIERYNSYRLGLKRLTSRDTSVLISDEELTIYTQKTTEAFVKWLEFLFSSKKMQNQMQGEILIGNLVLENNDPKDELIINYEDSYLTPQIAIDVLRSLPEDTRQQIEQKFIALLSLI